MSYYLFRKLIILVLVLIPFLPYAMPNPGMCVVGSVRIERMGTSSYLQACVRDDNDNLEWAYICGDDDGWSYDNAYVWCRTRHATLASESALGSLSPLKRNQKLKLKDVTCNRTQDATITDCEFTRTREACRYIHGVGCNFCSEDRDCNAPGVCNVENSQCLCNIPCYNGFCDLGRCQCPYPFYGESCKYKHCSSRCLNGGECLGNGTCQCLGDNYGDFCEFTKCSPECQNGGICHSTGECECPDPFHGNYCQHVRCSSSCQNGGECLGDGTCSCQPPFYGSLCHFKSCSNPCENGGICLANGTCQCQTSFYGEACQYKLCSADPCNNDGNCLNNGTCLCSSSFYGNACEFRFCVNPCKNDGICLGNGTCQCKASFYGNACEFTQCVSPCANGGECNASTGVCDCAAPYAGPACEEVTPCVYDCEFVLSPGNMLILILVGSSVGISILLILIFLVSVCLVRTAKKRSRDPLPTELSLRELPKQPEEPLYEYLDGDICSQSCSAARGNQLGESYLSNVYQYVQFPTGHPPLIGTERQDSLDLTYESVDANGYEVPLPVNKINNAHIWKLVPGKDQLSESYVKMYPTSSCPPLL